LKIANQSRISVLLFGPGRGANISTILEYFNDNKRISASLIAQEWDFPDNDFANISIIEYYHSNKLLRRIRLLFKLISLPRFDILYIQGGTVIYDLIIVFLFGRYRKSVFNIWGEAIINYMSKKSIQGYLYRRILKRMTRIQCNWYGTYNLLIEQDQHFIKNSIVIPWGLKSSFINNKLSISDFMKGILERIPSQKIVLLNMRSISEYNGISSLLRAISLIKVRNNDLFQKILLIFWPGNNIDEQIRDYILKYIKDNDLGNHVWYTEHPYLPDSEIRCLIERANIVLNIVKHDQLSISLLEALYLKKEMIITDIAPYKIFDEKYSLKLPLTRNDPDSIAYEVIKVVSRVLNNQENKQLAEYRKSIIESNFIMKKNYNSIMKLFEEILSFRNTD
jgi:hypothetical protein